MLKFFYIRKDPYGAITIAYFDQPAEKRILAGFSFCSPYDMFNTDLGRTIAINRLERFCISITDIAYSTYCAHPISSEVSNAERKTVEGSVVEIIDLSKTFIDYINNVLIKKKDLRKYLGVSMYKQYDEPCKREQFRWWLKKLIDLFEHEAALKNMKRLPSNVIVLKTSVLSKDEK